MMKTSRKPRPKTGWQRILTLLPDGWQEQAFEKKAMSHSRKFHPDSLLRSILIYLSFKSSLKETTFTASLLDQIEVSPVAFHYRFRKCADWLLWMAQQIMQRILTQIKNPNSLRGHRLRIGEVIGISFWGPRDDRAAGQPDTPEDPDAGPRGRSGRPDEATLLDCGEYPANRTRLSRGNSREDQGLLARMEYAPDRRRGSRPRHPTPPGPSGYGEMIMRQ